MKTAEAYVLNQARWQTHAEELYTIRRLVFIEELGMAPGMEQDQFDTDSWHILAVDKNGEAIASGRLSTDGNIGYVAVLQAWRNGGIGTVIVNHLLGLGQAEGLSEIRASIPVSTRHFFEKIGFRLDPEKSGEVSAGQCVMVILLTNWRQRSQGELWDGPLDGIADSISAATTLIKSVRRQICIYTPYVQARFYNTSDVLTELRRCVVEQPRIRCRLLLPPASEWRRDNAHLAQLVEHLSALELRTLPSEEARERSELAHAFILGDHSNLLYHTDPRLCIGSCTYRGDGKTRHLLEFFNEFWERSLPDRELRSLGI
jgi:predicted GNAT family N-acyltransferase